ncbi:hypothetical protein AB0H57_24525 [Micromonospora sp. NPDC050686]|uniref:hypothetical protein n=1 Tax=Micromonospora sp. NPDC050686 TaxID=3154631 RepID=UPI0033C8F2F3
MADRDVTLDVVARDRTSPAIQSVNRNLKQVEKSWRDVDGQGKKTLAAAQHIASTWGSGLAKIGGATSRWANSGDSAGKKFARGLGKGVGQVAELGGSIGGGLAKAVSAAGPYVQLALAGVLVGAAVAAAPAVAGAIVGGAALGGVVGGVLIAAKDARVAGAFADLKETAGAQLRQAAQRFVPATLDAIGRAKAAFRGMMPDLKRLFDVSANWVAPLTDSLGRAAQSMLSGITAAVTKAGPVVAQIGAGIEGIGQVVGKVFSDLSDNGASMALGLKGLFELLKATIGGIGGALNLLTEAFEFFVNKIPGGKQLLDSMTSSQDGAKTSAWNLTSGFRELGDGADAAADGITRAREKADEFADSNLSLRDAQIAARSAIADATKTLKENGAAKGFNTQKGRENESALNAMASAFNRETEAGDKSGRSARDASDAYQNNRAKLVAMAEKAGYSAGQARNLAAQLLKVPKNVTTDINADTKAASAAVTTFQKKVNGLKGKTVTVTVRVNNTGDHYIPGVGTQVKNAAGSSFIDGTAGSFRTGGPTRVEASVNQTLNVNLDGAPFYAYTARAVADDRRRTAWRQKVGSR